MKHVLMIAFALASVLLVAAGCGGSGKPSDNKGSGGDEKISRPEPTGDYKGKTNPTPDAVEEGKKLFANNCVLCHGEKGDGDSQVGSTLKPPSSDLTDPKLQAAMGDDYIFWRISEGGAALNYDGMTAFKDSLKEEQRWQLVAYVRSLKK